MTQKTKTATEAKIGRNVGFERIRRITGYIGKIDRWNNAKKAEERERRKHTVEFTK